MPRLPHEDDEEDDTIVPSTEPSAEALVPAPPPSAADAPAATSAPVVLPGGPQVPSAPPARSRSRAATAARAAAAEALTAKQGKLASQFALVTELGTHLYWHLLAASHSPTDARAYIYAQAPPQVQDVLQQLWRGGMTIDGISFDGTWLHTVIRSPDQLVPFKSMLRWLNGFSATVQYSGVPPSPWRLTAALSTVERIQQADSLSSSTPTNPAAN